MEQCLLVLLYFIVDFDLVFAKQGLQGLQAFAFCVVIVNYEHTKPRKTEGLTLKAAYAPNCV